MLIEFQLAYAVLFLYLLFHVTLDIVLGLLKGKEALLAVGISLGVSTLFFAVSWALLLASRNARKCEREGNGHANWVEFKAGKGATKV